MIVVATMVGTGVFTTTGFMVKDLGSPSAILVAWILGGLIAFAGATSYAELGAAFPKSGAEYAMLSRIYHPALGFTIGFTSFVVGFAAPIAASAIAFGSYLKAAVPGAPELVSALGLIAALTVLHARDVDTGSTWQNALTIGKIALIAIFCLGGLAFGDPALLDAPARPIGEAIGSSSFAIALIFVSYAYSGWNGSAYIAGELRDPARNVPISLLAGTAIVTALYVALNMVYFLAAPAQELSGVVEVAHVAATRLFGSGAGRALSSIIALNLISNAGAMLMTGSRVTVEMGLDYPRLRLLARRTRGGAPVVSVLLQSALAVLMVLSASFDALLTYVGFTLSIATGLAVFGVIVLRIREPELPRPYRAFGYPILPLCFVGITVWTIIEAIRERPLVVLAGIGTIGAGLLAYALVREPGNS
jgi:basic amino acid/polyamine antiporter, APA family